MSDAEPPTRAEVENPYRIASPAATSTLAGRLRERIGRAGPLDFAEFMAAALYDPCDGYYAREPRQIGRGGDFFTSVSVGPVFGTLLAGYFHRIWENLNNPPRWRVLECGAHDGTLAADILRALRERHPVAHAALEYAIVEPLPQLREVQRRTLAGQADGVVIVDSPARLPQLPGVIFGNEVLDALPCHLVVARQGAWMQRRVAGGSNGFRWDTTLPVSDPAALAMLDSAGRFPEGYQTELRTNFGKFLAPLAHVLAHGSMLWIDYGFERAEYQDPARVQGTLRTFSQHRAADDPLVSPGEIDITAHVDFTAVIEAASRIGLAAEPLRDQGSWLTRVASGWLLEMENQPQPALLRQFQTLTHPAHLGRAFQVLELRK